MEGEKWGEVLLQWIMQTDFLENNCFNIEETEVNMFFQNYYKHVQYNEASADDGEGASLPEITDLVGFLQAHYPEYHPDLGENNALVSSEYVHVYSLLLHFCCVKYPQRYFHNICRRLPERSQELIAEFFKRLLNCTITRAAVRHVIIDINANEDANDLRDSVKGSSKPADDIFQSPKSMNRFTHQCDSTSTPQSSLLDERTRELYDLRAQLETERYEKFILEMEVKKDQENIFKISKDYKKLQQQIFQLKDNNRGSPKQDTNKEIEQKLYDVISRKEEEISLVTDVLNATEKEKTLMQEKLSFTEKQYGVCISEMKELDCKVDKLSAEVRQKDDTIEMLTKNNLELENFIAEVRSSSINLNCDQSESVDDFLNKSLSPIKYTFETEENLGCSVVDVQLREAKIENQQLRKSLAELRLENDRLAEYMRNIARRHSERIKHEKSKLKELQEEIEAIRSTMCRNDQDMIRRKNAMFSMVQYYSKLFELVLKFQSEIDEMRTCIQGVGKIVSSELKSIIDIN